MLTRERILCAIDATAAMLGATGVARPRIAVAGLNPHAGEGGVFGREEIDIIGPAVEDGRRRGHAVEGPFPADTIWIKARRGDYDAVLSMYHDQGQIALKLLGFERGVTILGGLPVPIATPAHGLPTISPGAELPIRPPSSRRSKRWSRSPQWPCRRGRVRR